MNAKTPSSADKRTDPRLITFLPVGVKLSKKSGEEVGVFKIINLSCSGLSLLVAQPLNIGAVVSIKIKLPDGKTSIKGTAQVQRCEELAGHPDHLKQYLCGLSLTISPEDRPVLDRFIRDIIQDGSGVVDRRTPERIRNGLVLKNPEKYRSFKLSHDGHHIQIHQLGLRDLNDLEKVEIAAWGEKMAATRAMLSSRLTHFSEGMIGARKDGKLLGYVCLMMIDSTLCDKDFTWMGITDGGHIRATHNPNGDCLYGVSLSVAPSAPKDLAVKLLKGAGKLAIRKALKGILLGCRLPNYHKFAKRMPIEQYINAMTKRGRLFDPELAMYRQLNAVPVRAISNYFEDPDSLNYGLLVFWRNPFFEIQRSEYPFFFKNVTVEFT